MERIGQETDIGQGFPFSVAITTLSGVGSDLKLLQNLSLSWPNSL